MSRMNNDSEAVIAVNRFGLGARGSELAAAARDPRQWLTQQMVSPSYGASRFTTVAAFQQFSEYRQRVRDQRKAPAQNESSNMQAKGPSGAGTTPAKVIRQTQRALIFDGLWQSIMSAEPFSMRMLDFFSNHFSVSMTSIQLNVLAPLLERDAVAPHLFGQFEDMLIAVIKHPAMLVYLDNTQSTGPASRVGKKRQRGLNENLAREILELHTLGIDGGYSLGDIRELARALSGWSISRPRDKAQKGFVYRRDMHEPGARTLLGRRYRDGEVEQGEQMLRDLARHPATGRFVCHKLAQHLVSDMPDEGLVDAMSAQWQQTNGNLGAVIRVLIAHDASWREERQKFKTPREFVISTLRALEIQEDSPPRFLRQLHRHLRDMGQAPFGSGSPAGYPISNRHWDGADALMKRIDWANTVVAVSAQSNKSALEISSRLFSTQLDGATRQAMERAETDRQARALLFLSPDFQRR